MSSSFAPVRPRVDDPLRQDTLVGVVFSGNSDAVEKFVTHTFCGSKARQFPIYSILFPDENRHSVGCPLNLELSIDILPSDPSDKKSSAKPYKRLPFFDVNSVGKLKPDRRYSDDEKHCH